MRADRICALAVEQKRLIPGHRPTLLRIGFEAMEKISVSREAITKLITAIDELNTAKPLIEQSAWRSVCLWADVLRGLGTGIPPR